jgi:uncharacterized peroxidase-related enzyme
VLYDPFMSTVPIPTPDRVPQASQPILDAIEKRLGFTPNLFRLMASSPAVLIGHAKLQDSLAAALDLKTRVNIALAVSEANGCDYCLASHTFHGLAFARLTPEEIALNRQGHSNDPKIDAAVNFAQQVIETRGHVGPEAVARVAAAGYIDAQIIEIIAVAAAFMLSNLINNVAQPEVDFPAISESDAD